jgi:hypothetical protein
VSEQGEKLSEQLDALGVAGFSPQIEDQALVQNLRARVIQLERAIYHLTTPHTTGGLEVFSKIRQEVLRQTQAENDLQDA